MRPASSCFTDADRKRINEAVVAAESGTSAEVVPAVATASGRYDRPEDLVGLWAAILGACAFWWFVPRASAEGGSWSGGLAPELMLVALVAILLAGFAVGAVVGSRIGWLRRLFTPRQQMREEVAARASQLFFDGRVHHTAGRTGLLVYVSLYEHAAAVIADKIVTEKLGQPALDELCRHLTEKLRAGGSVVDALCDVLKEAGERLAPVLPRAADDVNELPDALILLDD